MKSGNVPTAVIVFTAIVLAGFAGWYLVSGTERVVVRTYAGEIEEGIVMITETIHDSNAPTTVDSHSVVVKVTIKLEDQSVVVGVTDAGADTWEKIEQCFMEDMPKCYAYTLYHSGGRIFRDWTYSRDGVTARGDYLANEALLDKAVREVMRHNKQISIK